MRNGGGYIGLDFAQAVLSEYDSDKFLGITLDHYGEEEAGGHAAEAVMPLGMLARPLDPDVANDGSPQVAAPVLTMTEGDRLHAMPLTDPRTVTSMPPLKKGGFMTYCPASPKSFALYDGKDPAGKSRAGSYTLAVTYGSKAHFFQFDIRTDGKEAVSLVHGEGMGILMVAGGKRSLVVKNASGKSHVTVDDDGILLAGKTKVQGSLSVGNMPAVDGLLKAKAFASWAAMIEGALSGLGGVVATPFASLLEVVATKNLKGS